jgi:Predicted transcriptional regulator with C-terminal CBS domains
MMVPTTPEEFKAARLAAGFGRNRIAERAEIEVNTIWRIEIGRHKPRPSTWLLMTKALRELIAMKGEA